MYGKKLIARHIAKASRKLGFQLEYHRKREILEQVKRLNELLDDAGRLRRPLSSTEEQWIYNEQALCKFDFRYFIENYWYVKHFSDNRIVLFMPNVAQNICIDIWAMLEEMGRAISIQQLKARQLGVSTLTEAAIAHRTQFYTHVNAVTASSDPGKSAKMAEMMERGWQNEPWWLLPRQTKYK